MIIKKLNIVLFGFITSVLLKWIRSFNIVKIFSGHIFDQIIYCFKSSVFGF